MPAPSDLANASNAIQWTNGKGLVTGATLASLFGIVIAVFATIGTWNASGVFTPSIPAGTITGAEMSAGAAAANLGFAPLSSIPAPTATTLGGVKSTAAAASYYGTGIDTTGAPTFARPSFADLTGAATAAQTPTACQLTGCTLTGALAAPSYSAGSVAGVSCTGAPTSSYAVTNGIVTHC